MKIERKRYCVMRKNRTEIYCRLGMKYCFRDIENIGDTSVVIMRFTEEAAKRDCGEDSEIVPVIEIITDEEK